MAEAQAPTTTTGTTPTGTTPPANSADARTPDGTLINQAPAPEPPAGGPPSDGYKFEGNLDPAAIEGASALFKELGLTQAQAQRLVDFQSSRDKVLAEAVDTTRSAWRRATESDPEIGDKLDKVRTEIGRAMTHLEPQLVQAFRAAMDFTGVGDNPDFIKAFYKFSQLINEGQHVSGAGPSREGQTQVGKSARPTQAAAMYPNLQ
jgi:hypothetical protein